MSARAAATRPSTPPQHAAASADCCVRSATDEALETASARVLATADAKIFHRSYGDQHGELWSPNGRLLATTTQIAYFKA